MAGRFSVDAVFRAVDRVTQPIARMQRSVRRFTQSTVNNLGTINRATNRVASGFFTIGKAATVAGTGAATAAGLIFTSLNKSTVEAEALSAAMGVNATTAKAIAKEIEPIGLSIENVTDLVEEMNNKFGESAGLEEITPVTEALDILGLKFEELNKMSPDKQFETLTSAMLKHTNATEAASAADILFGGEANKIISVLRRQGKTIDELTSDYEKLNFLTSEGTGGANDFVDVWSDVALIIGSVTKQFAGLLGGILAPLLKRFTEWAKLNRELIGTKIEEWVEKTVETFIKMYEIAVAVFNWFRENIDTISKVAATIGVLIVALKIMAAVMMVVNAVMYANPIGLIILAIVALIAAIVALIIWWDDLVAAITNTDAWKATQSFLTGMFEGIFELWNSLKQTVIEFFDAIMEKWQGFKDLVNSGLDFIGLGDDDEQSDTVAGGVDSPVIMGSAATYAANGVNRDKVEIKITDETGKASVAKNTMTPGALKLSNSGAF